MAASVDQLARMAQELVKEAELRGARLRLLGGLAFYLASPEAAAKPGFQREYKDLDFAVDKKGTRVIPEVFTSRGWEGDRYFNALHGKTRLLFTYQMSLQADIFIDVFEQCHRLDLGDRLGLSSPTLPLADLLLTKLQIHQVNEKDAKDVFALLLGHDFSSQPSGDQISLARIVDLTSQDWGWYTTIHDNINFLNGVIGEYVDGQEAGVIRARLSALREAMEAAPKGLRWQLRNQIGRRMAWYDEPEEVNR